MLQRVTRSTVIDAPIARVWAILRDFNSHEQWHDIIASSRIEGNERSDQIGCVRNFALKDGNRIREQLLTLSDTDHRSTYCILDATVPLQRYVSTLTLKPVTDGDRTFWHWTSTFSTPPGMEHELHDMVAQGVYEAGFVNLRRYLQQGGDGRSTREAPLPSGLVMSTRQVVAARPGNVDMLQVQSHEVAAPSEGEVRIRQHSIGVNYIDIYLRRGSMPELMTFPGVPGMEAAGTVVDVGPNASGLLPGDRVAYVGPVPGAYCGLRCVPADWVVRLPAAVEDDTAVTVMLKGVTADLLLHDIGHVQRGTRVLVHAAAGGLGLLVCAWARSLGAVVLGTVSSDEKARVARAYGCEHVIVTQDYRFADAVQRACGGADVVIDGLGQAARDENLAALARRGHWISVGQASGVLRPLSPDALMSKSLSFSRPVVFDYIDGPGQLAMRSQRIWEALAGGSIQLPPIERHGLEAAAAAHARLESRATIGALVLIP